MYPIRPTAGFEPTDPYEKAKMDILKALDSIRVLSAEQQKMLARELLGAESVAALLNLVQQMR